MKSNEIKWKSNENKWKEINSKSAGISQQLLRFRMEFPVLGEQSIIKSIWRFYLHIQTWQTNLTYIYFHIKKSLTLNQINDHDSLIKSNVFFNPGVCKILSPPSPWEGGKKSKTREEGKGKKKVRKKGRKKEGKGKGIGKIEREKGRLRGKEKYRKLRKWQGREIEGEGKKKVG